MPTRKKTKESEVKVEKKETDLKKDENKYQIYWIIGIMAIMVIVILLIPSISRWHNTFGYQGLTFTKELYGQISVFHYYYYAISPDNQQVQENIYLRDDPRTNNVSMLGGLINYPPLNSTIYLSINGTGITECSNAQRDVATLDQFVLNNFFNIKAGISDKALAQADNLSYITCATNPADMVIALQSSNQTSISISNNCYTFDIGSCQGLTDAVEKFEVQSILDAKLRQNP